MGVKAELKALVDELDRVHRGAVPDGIPDFVTAENGMQRYFTRRSREALLQLCTTLHSNRSLNLLRIELEDYIKIVRQAVADMHAADEFLNFHEINQGNHVAKLQSLIEERLESAADEHTHYFPAWTVGMEQESPFSLGPVTFLKRTDWIESVDFPQQAKDKYLNQPEINHRWKEIIKDALSKPRDSTPIGGLAAVVYTAIEKCPALVKVTVRGYEVNFSRKLARLVAKSALDAISLGFGPAEFFHQQALGDERLPPVASDSLVESSGFLWLPGMSFGERMPSFTPDRVKQALADMGPVLSAFASILEGLIDPASHPHPKLASRWATALDWFGEGNRESSDAIALAKLGTCLDVLCCGGKYGGITDMVVRLTGIDEKSEVLAGSRPRTLGQLVKDVYNRGRSQILHGTHHDRLMSFTAERQHAAHLARIVLIKSAQRLQHYCGIDVDKAFRTI